MSMGKEVMRRRAADNSYFHRDFHATMNQGLIYLQEKYGISGVRDYLRQLGRSFYSPLSESLRRDGLGAVRRYLEKVYSEENAEYEIDSSEDHLEMKIALCPAVAHIRKLGFPVSDLFFETTKSLYDAICEGTPFDFRLEEYDPGTGKSRFRFFRRSQ
jgi:hypothetical protein